MLRIECNDPTCVQASRLRCHVMKKMVVKQEQKTVNHIYSVSKTCKHILIHVCAHETPTREYGNRNHPQEGRNRKDSAIIKYKGGERTRKKQSPQALQGKRTGIGKGFSWTGRMDSRRRLSNEGHGEGKGAGRAGENIVGIWGTHYINI